MLSGTNNFNETSALGLGVTHSLLYGPVPVRLPDLSQQTAPALPASILGEAPQGSSLDALASMASFSAEHHRANARPSAGDGEHADVDGSPLYGPLPDDWRSRGTLGTPRQHGPSASGLGHELTSGHGE